MYLDTLRGLQTLVEMQQTVIAEAMDDLAGRRGSATGKRCRAARRGSKDAER